MRGSRYSVMMPLQMEMMTLMTACCVLLWPPGPLAHLSVCLCLTREFVVTLDVCVCVCVSSATNFIISVFP